MSNPPYLPLTSDKFPIIIEAFHRETGELAWRKIIERPGPVYIPGVLETGFKVRIRMTFGDGEVRESA